MLNYPYLSIQETVDKTKLTLEEVKKQLDVGYFDFDEANIFGTGSKQDSAQRLNKEDQTKLLETFRKAPLKEFLAKSGTTGIAGAAYLIPDKIYQIMYDSAVQADICADISIAMIPPDQIPGANLKVDVAVDGSYIPHKFSSGGKMPEEEIKTVQPEMKFTDSWGINFRIANDLIEDSQFDIIEMHIRDAGREMGEFATNEAVTVLTTATDGDGSLNGYGEVTDTAITTKWAGDTNGVDIEGAIDKNVQDGYVSDTILLSHHVMMHTVMRTVGTTAALDESAPWIYHCIAAPEGGWPTKMFDLNLIYSEVTGLTGGGDYAPCVSVVFDKDYALLTGRKRWLRIEKYSDPVRDLVGATVTARQDSVTVYNDSICIVTECT